MTLLENSKFCSQRGNYSQMGVEWLFYLASSKNMVAKI